MPILFVNGRFLPEAEAGIAPLDRGFLFADAIYEVVRYDRGRPYRLAEHLSRMREGLDVLRSHRHHPGRIVVVLSNYATKQMREDCIRLGADGVFDKSTQLDAFFSFCASQFPGHH